MMNFEASRFILQELSRVPQECLSQLHSVVQRLESFYNQTNEWFVNQTNELTTAQQQHQLLSSNTLLFHDASSMFMNDLSQQSNAVTLQTTTGRTRPFEISDQIEEIFDEQIAPSKRCQSVTTQTETELIEIQVDLSAQQQPQLASKNRTEHVSTTGVDHLRCLKPNCDFCSVVADEMFVHLKEVHQLEPELLSGPSDQSAPYKSGAPRFRCKWPHCKLDYRRKQSLVRHIRVKHLKLPATIRVQREHNILDDRDPHDFVKELLAL